MEEEKNYLWDVEAKEENNIEGRGKVQGGKGGGVKGVRKGTRGNAEIKRDMRRT